MTPETPAPPPAAAPAPPHPFRAAPWYEPEAGDRTHRPCQCPHCRAKRRGLRPGRPLARTLAVALGGVLLPLVALAVNTQIPVVHLGPLGTAWLAFGALSALAHLIWSPVLRDPDRGDALRHRAPRALAGRLALLAASLWSGLFAAYLALLFLPILPLCLVAVIAMGLGLCGLSPYTALGVALAQIVQDARAVARTMGRRATAWTVVLLLGLPLLGLGGVGGQAAFNRHRLELELAKIALLPPHSDARMEAIAAMEGRQETLVQAYLASADREQHRLLAEVHLRLTDHALAEEVRRRLQTRRQTVIFPWWFLHGGDVIEDRWLSRW